MVDCFGVNLEDWRRRDSNIIYRIFYFLWCLATVYVVVNGPRLTHLGYLSNKCIGSPQILMARLCWSALAFFFNCFRYDRFSYGLVCEGTSDCDPSFHSYLIPMASHKLILGRGDLKTKYKERELSRPVCSNCKALLQFPRSKELSDAYNGLLSSPSLENNIGQISENYW